MRKISVDNIDPAGCIVAANVVSNSGNTLLSVGDRISPAMGRRLRNWGISFVYVEGGSGDSAESVRANAKSPMDIRSELYDVFLGTLNNPRMMKVFEAVYKNKLHKLEGGV